MDKINLNLSGIYSIKNKLNGKIYVGSSNKIRKRWAGHRCKFKKGDHDNNFLQNTFNKHGFDCFQWEVLEFCEIEDLIKCEQKWIDFYKSADREYGYNLLPIAYSQQGYQHTEENRKKLSIAHLGNTHSDESKKKIAEASYKTIYQIDMNTLSLIASFDSIKEASEKTGILKQGISMCARGVIKQSGGFHWSFDFLNFTKPIRCFCKPQKIKIYKHAITNIEWKTQREAANDLNLSTNQIKTMIKNKKINIYYEQNIQ